MFEEGQGGRFFPAGDSAALRRIAEELVADPTAIDRLAERIPVWPDWPAATATMARLLQRTLDSG
jgi:hypothetical protein